MYIYPILEWFAHYMLHKINERRHKRHHILFFNNSVRTERWTYFYSNRILFKELYNNGFIFVLFVIHTCIHKFPSLLPKITEHHISHHKDQRYNFCVSAIWPDKMFKTYKPIE